MFSVLDTTGKDLSWIDSRNYHLVRSPGDISQLEDHLSQSGRVPSFDLETEGLSYIVQNIAGISMSPEPGHAYYIPINHKYFDNLDIVRHISDIRRIFDTREWVTFNGGFDVKFAKNRLGLDVKVKRDVMVDAYLLDSDRGPKNNRKKLRLDYLSKELLGVDQLHLEDLLPKDVYDFTLVQDEQDALYYAGGDADCTLRVGDKIQPRIDALKLGFVSSLEVGQIKPVAKMELRGIYIDQPYAEALDLTPEILRIEQLIAKAIGHPINPGSPQETAAVIYDELQLIKPDAKGNKSTDDKILDKLKALHPVIPLLRDWREHQKIQSSFLEKLQDVAAEDGRLHGEFCPTGTRSGRYASWGGIGKGGAKIKINGQTFPTVRNDSLVNIRKILRATPGFYWASADFSQIEYRVLTYVSGDPSLREAYANGIDMHVKTASTLFKVPVSAVTEELRGRGKTLNFAVVYGMTDPGLALALKTSIKEAQGLRAAYFKAIPRVDKLIRETKAFISKLKYVRTEFGRIRNYDFTGLDPKHIEALLSSGFNTRIQGTAADINKIALIKLDNLLEKNFGNRVFLLSTIHDEVNMEVVDEVPVDEITQFLHEHFAFKPGLKPDWLDFPIDVCVGRNFGEIESVPKGESIKTPEQLFDFILEKQKTKKLKKLIDIEERRIEIIDAPKRRVPLQAPAVVVQLPDNANQRHVDTLRDLVQNNYGKYALFIKSGQEHYIANMTTVNPGSLFIDTLRRDGFQVEVLKPSGNKHFDPSKLDF